MSESPESVEGHDYNLPPFTTRQSNIDEEVQDALDMGARLKHLSLLNMYSPPQAIRRTSIVCTIGPESNNVTTLVELRRAGMNIVRLNCAQYSTEFHSQLLANLSDSFHRLPGPLITVALDIKGSEIRTGGLENGLEVEINTGDTLTLTTDERYINKGNNEILYVDCPGLAGAVSLGSTVYIDDGLLRLTVVDVLRQEGAVRVQAMNGGLLAARRSVIIPSATLDLPAVTESDIANIRWAVRNDVDIIMCMAHKAADVVRVREVLGEEARKFKIVAKVGSQEGLSHFSSILSEADGIVVGRGDLGAVLPPEKVFLAQKMMVARCNLAGKPSICATQMLASMGRNPRPTRAEVNDVGNAVLDGVDCVMLSGELSRGPYLAKATQMMHRVCTEAESAFFHRTQFNELINHTKRRIGDTEETVAIAAVHTAYSQNAAAIICLTTSGRTAAYVSKYRPQCPVLTVTRKERVVRQLNLYRSIFPMRYPLKKHEIFQDDVDSRIHWCITEAKGAGYLTTGDTVVGIQGWRDGVGHTNTIRILVVS